LPEGKNMTSQDYPDYYLNQLILFETELKKIQDQLKSIQDSTDKSGISGKIVELLQKIRKEIDVLPSNRINPPLIP
jgi:uncharacterized protein (UPF0335 family)